MRKINWPAILFLLFVFYLGMVAGNYYTIKTAIPVDSHSIIFDGVKHYYN